MLFKRIHLLAGIIPLLIAGLPARAQVTTLHNFSNTPDGALPLRVVSANGLVFGVTSIGGATGNGAIFTFDPNSSTYATNYSFTGAFNNGGFPNNLLVSGNTIYGTAQYYGTNGYGMVYAVGTNGNGFTPLYSFGGYPDGQNPRCALVLIGGTLYGTTYAGGAGTNGGTVFKINTNGTGYATLWSFTNSFDGSGPPAELVTDGSTLYGTTTLGGTNNNGIIFAISTNGNGYTILHSFTNAPEPVQPYGGLVLSGGVLYGTGIGGGTNGTGAIFAINTNGTGFKTLHSFSALAGNLDGASPEATLTLDGSVLYGTAYSGGSGNGGTIFSINTNGSGFAVVASFTNNLPPDGASPVNGVILLGNALWGTTSSGGSVGYGTLFYDPQGPSAPAIVQQPQNYTVTNGNNAAFTNVASGTAPLYYQWYLNTNTAVSGGTNAILTFTPATTNQAGYYTVIVTNLYGSATSAPARLMVVVPGLTPVITQEPQNYTVTNGYNAAFTNVASGTAPLYYQWYLNTNTAVSGGTNAILTFTPATTNEAGYYTVIVTNLYGSATSAPARLMVVVPGLMPVITQEPQNYTVTNGNNAAFTNVASGTAPLYYQWYLNTNTAVSGGTNAILTFTPATTNQAGYYTVIVTNLYGSATSAPARLMVVVPVSTPVITQEPQNYTVTNGYNAAFTNVASGTAPLYYQWYLNTNTAVAGGTNSILLLTFVTTNQAGYYTVIVTNLYGSATSAPAGLTVISTAPIILSQPAPATVTNGAAVSFTVVAAGQNPLKYQWYTNSVSTSFALSHQTNSALSFAAASNNLAGIYLVVLTNALGKATSNPALLTVFTKPVITQSPQNVVVTNGDSATFNSAATGAGLLSFQWFFRTNTAVAGATNFSLTFTNAITNLAGFYSVRVTNTFGSTTSSYALLSVSNHLNFLSFSFNSASGSASFTLANVARSTNRLWASTNLTSTNFWQVLATNVMATNGLWFYTDTNAATTNRARFYRFSTP